MCRATLTITLLSCLAALAADAHADDSDDLEWLRQNTFGADEDDVVGDALSSIDTYRSLEALATAESWACAPAQPDCLHTFWSGKLAGAFPEARLVGERGESACIWRLVVRSDSGWLRSITLGVSPPDCTSPLDVERFSAPSYWYPRAVTQSAEALRIEGQGEGQWENWGYPSELSRNRIDHAVRLCRIESNALVCAQERSRGRAIVGDTALAPQDLEPLPLDPTLLPLTDAAAPGARLPADYLGPPTRAGRRAHIGVLLGAGNARVFEWAVGQDRIIAVETVGDPGWSSGSVSVWREHGGKLRRVYRRTSYRSNEDFKLAGHDVVDSVLRLSIEHVSDGGSTTLTRRWDLAFVPRPEGMRCYALPSGMTLADATGMVGGWWIAIDATRDGVRMVEADGPLAWFRETGRWTWAELEARLPLWRARMAKALRQADALRVRKADAPSREEREPLVPLDFLPGYVETFDAVLVPHIIALP